MSELALVLAREVQLEQQSATERRNLLKEGLVPVGRPPDSIADATSFATSGESASEYAFLRPLRAVRLLNSSFGSDTMSTVRRDLGRVPAQDALNLSVASGNSNHHASISSTGTAAYPLAIPNLSIEASVRAASRPLGSGPSESR